MDKIPIDKYRLRFPDKLEKDFLEDYFNKSLSQMRISMILTAVLFSLFGILDAWITPEVKTQAWLVRYAFIVPGFIAGFLFTFTPYFKKYVEATMFSLLLLAGGGIIALLVIVRSPVNYFHFGGLFLVMMYTYILGNIRFVYTCTAAWTVIGAYEIASYAIGNVRLPVFVTDNIFLIAANIGGMIFGYNREMYMRKDFYYARTVRELEEKKHHIEKEQLQQAVEAATKSLRESESRFRTLAETTAAAIFIHDGEQLLYVNPAGEKMSGYTSAELLQKNFWTFIHPDYQEMVRVRGQARVIGKQVPTEYEFKFTKKNGDDCWVTITTGFIEHRGRPAVIATLFDITDRRRAEEEKVRLYEARIVEEQRHIMEKEKLMMDLHDGIGGITTNINILAELARKARDMESINKTLATISQLSREGVSEIRSFMQSLESEDLSWHALIAEFRKQGTTLVEPHCIHFTVEASVKEAPEQPGSLLWVNLLRIYKEALTNVIKHSRAETVAVSFTVDCRRLQLMVQDDGVGWDGDAKRGRGLPNMKRRVQEVGGNVTIAGLQRGTRVGLEIPLPIKYPIRSMEL